MAMPNITSDGCKGAFIIWAENILCSLDAITDIIAVTFPVCDVSFYPFHNRYK